MSAPQSVIGNRSRIRVAFDPDMHERCEECRKVINGRRDKRWCNKTCRQRWLRAREKEAAQ